MTVEQIREALKRAAAFAAMVWRQQFPKDPQ
jgi:hypothetical protein